AICSTGW
ncbi:hypothetical protein D048_4177B, partial [Vibrio parahaemolyticus VPTS-2009]